MSGSRICFVLACIVFALAFFGVSPFGNMTALGLFLVALGLAL